MRPPSTTLGKLIPAAVALALVLAAGTTGFVRAFHTAWPLGVYRTLVTVATLGDARVVPTTPAQYAVVGGLSLLSTATAASSPCPARTRRCSRATRCCSPRRGRRTPKGDARGETDVNNGRDAYRYAATMLRHSVLP